MKLRKTTFAIVVLGLTAGFALGCVAPVQSKGTSGLGKVSPWNLSNLGRSKSTYNLYS